MAPAARWTFLLLCLVPFLGAEGKDEYTVMDSGIDTQDSSTKHAGNIEGNDKLQYMRRQRRTKMQPLEAVLPRHNHFVDSSSLAILKTKANNPNDYVNDNTSKEGSTNRGGNGDSKKPGSHDPPDSGPSNLFSRWCKSDTVLLSTSELTLLNVSAVLVLIMLTIW